MDPSTEIKPAVILVHGTFAGDENDAVTAGARWWQRNGVFANTLANAVVDEALIQRIMNKINRNSRI